MAIKDKNNDAKPNNTHNLDLLVAQALIPQQQSPASPQSAPQLQLGPQAQGQLQPSEFKELMKVLKIAQKAMSNLAGLDGSQEDF